MRLPDHCSVFQAELSAIQAAVKIIVDKNVHRQKITILFDIQADIKALDYSVRRCTTVADVSMRWRIDMMFVSHGYQDIEILPAIAERMI